MFSKTTRLYIDHITKKFNREFLKNGDVSMIDFIEWYNSYRKAYTSIKCMIDALTHLDFKYIDDFHAYILSKQKEEQNMKDLYAKCVSLNYTDTFANMKKTLQIIQSKYNIEKMTHDQAVKICESEQDKYVLILNKIIILKVLEYDITQLSLTLKHRENRLIFLRNVATFTKTRLKYIKEIDDMIPNIETISNLSTSQLVKIAKTYRYRSILMRVYKLYSDELKMSEILSELSHEYTNITKVEYFFLQRPTQELREIFDNIMNDHQIRLKKSSTYVDDRIKDIELRIISFLEFINVNSKKTQGDNIMFFLKHASPEQIHNLILKYGNESNYNNERVKSKTGRYHHARHRLNIAIGFLQKVAEVCGACEYIKTLKVNEFLIQIENKSELLDWNKRRVYTDDEIDKMLDTVKNIPQDTLLITLLREVGLRNAAICNLKFCDILDDTKNPRHICKVREKGNKIREFVTSNNIKVKILCYIRTLNEIQVDHYVFSRTKNKRLGYSTLNVILKRIALQSGVTNVNVQAHSFRHTLVGKLMDAGNRIEVVSKFMGHSSVDTTMTYYWLKNIEELSSEINNPFMGIYETKRDEEECVGKKLDACFSIIGFYRNEIDNADNMETLKRNVFYQNHKIDRVLKYIADSSVDESTKSQTFRYEQIQL